MTEHKIRHLPVLEGGKLVGIVSERDILQLERLRQLDDQFTVEDAMVEDVYAVDSEQPTDEVVEAMATNKYGAAVVCDRRGSIEGIFTTVDGMQVLAEVLRRAVA